MNWFAARRLDYIDFRLVTAGTVNRADIMLAFGVSMVQASADLTAFAVLYPGSLRYDKSAKCYTARPGYRTLRGNTAAVLKLIAKLRAVGHPLGWE